MTDDLTRFDLVQIAETTVAEDCPEEGGDEQACEPGAGAGVIVINQPPDGEVVQVATQDGQRYLLNFPRHLATLRVIDADGDGQADHLALVFNAGTREESQVVFLDLVAHADGSNPPIFQIDGVQIGSDALVNLALVGDQPTLEAAAGEGEGEPGHGANVYSDGSGPVAGFLDPEGPISPRFMGFGLQDQEVIDFIVKDFGTPPLADPVETPATLGDEDPPIPEDVIGLLGTVVVFFKELSVDGVIGDSDIDIADFGGTDGETSLENLVFTLLSQPAYGTLVLQQGNGGPASILNVGDTFTSAGTIWWVATSVDVAEFDALEPVTFNYSVTDQAGNSAEAPVVITLPLPPPPTATLGVFQEFGDCLNEDTEGALFFTATPGNAGSEITEIVISGFPTGDVATAWLVDNTSVDLFGFDPGDFTANYNSATGTLTITILGDVAFGER